MSTNWKAAIARDAWFLRGKQLRFTKCVTLARQHKPRLPNVIKLNWTPKAAWTRYKLQEKKLSYVTVATQLHCEHSRISPFREDSRQNGGMTLLKLVLCLFLWLNTWSLMISLKDIPTAPAPTKLVILTRPCTKNSFCL